MMYESIVLGLLASAAVARPQHGHYHKRFHPSGTAVPHPPPGTAPPFPSGPIAPYPTGNSTLPWANSTGTGIPPPPPVESTSTVENVVTMTVVPVPVSSESAAATTPTSVDVNNNAATGIPAEDPATCGGSQSTTTVTTTEVVTVTLGGEDAASTEAATSNAPAEFFAPTYPSTSPAAEVAVAAATTASSASIVETAVYEAPTSTVETSSSTVEASTSSSSTSAAATPTVSSASGTSSSSKRGLAYNDVALTELWAGKPVSWAYNWAATSGGTVGEGLEYVPMAWCTGSISKDDWTEAANSAIASGSTHLLGFNEPDQPGQCNIDAASAAAGHKDYMNQFSGKAQIGSPAVTNGGGSMGLTYLQSFFDNCAGGCNVDFLNIHWYGGAGDGIVDNFKSHINSAIELANKNNIAKIWVTEFALDGADDAATASFLGEVLPFLDGLDQVERYAFFMCKEGSLVNGNAISSTIGAAYVA